MLHEERKAFFKKKPLASLVYDKGANRCGGIVQQKFIRSAITITFRINPITV